MDGIDAVLIRTDGKNLIETICGYSLDYPSSFKIELKKAELLVRKAQKDVAPEEIVNQSTLYHAEAVKQLLYKSKANEIDLIGYHGQTLYHNPKQQISLQIGDGQLLANLTKIKVVNDFRSEDIRNGGEGAPLAPLYHKALLEKINYYPATIVNCGGISNVTIFTKSSLIGFDTGPGNVLIDQLIRNRTNNKEFYDKDGKYGLNGKVNDLILQKLIHNFLPYLNHCYPKSLDSSSFFSLPELENLSLEDAAATLEHFTSYCIVNSIPDELLTQKWVLAGGGWKNPVIKSALEFYLKQKIMNPDVKIADEIGLSSQYMEAEIFAYLAAKRFLNLPTSLASITGASHDSSGGTLYFPV